MKVLAIIQARTSSSRLPNKVLKLILGKPMLIHQIERVQLSKMIDHLVVSTSEDSSDDQLVGLLKNAGIDCYRGSLKNVLDRFFQTASIYNPDHIVRLTGDCPVIDFEIIDKVVELHLDNGFDYTSNAPNSNVTFPDGLDVEVMKFGVLKKAWKESTLPSEREHVTPYINNHPEIFFTGCYVSHQNLSKYRWTVDEPEDFDLIEKIYHSLYYSNKAFKMKDILQLMDKNPKMEFINQKIERNEGMKKSFIDDKDSLSNEY
jgi:spore coat polysaccharide biosynthesis protein SpsF